MGARGLSLCSNGLLAAFGSQGTKRTPELTAGEPRWPLALEKGQNRFLPAQEEDAGRSSRAAKQHETEREVVLARGRALEASQDAEMTLPGPRPTVHKPCGQAPLQTTSKHRGLGDAPGLSFLTGNSAMAPGTWARWRKPNPREPAPGLRVAHAEASGQQAPQDGAGWGPTAAWAGQLPRSREP